MRCLTPFYVEKYKAQVPCGRCYNCYATRVCQWTFRLMEEYKRCDYAHFVTLTYDTEHVPYTEDGRQTVCKKDIQLFIKRLRSWQRRHETKQFKKAQVPMSRRRYSKIKYYLAAEYGDKTIRPHYHMILYNSSAQAVEETWNRGTSYYGTVTAKSVAYTLKYMSKQCRVGTSYQDTRTKPFALMSLGLGSSYLTPTMIKWHKADLIKRMYVTTQDGYKIPMPRYYKLKMYNALEKEKIANEALQAEIERIYLEAVTEFGNVKAFRAKKQNILAANRRMKYNHLLTQKL